MRKVTDRPPLIVHLIYHLDVGGLENGLVNLINHIPSNRYRHAIVCLKGYTGFSKRITRSDVELVALNKREGHDWRVYFKLFSTLRRLNPDILHTRNLAAMEGQLVAVFARVRARVHGEHGRDMFDLHGKNRKYNLLRKLIQPWVDHFIAVSQDLEHWLIHRIGTSPERVSQIHNGVDSLRFHPRSNQPSLIGPPGFFTENAFVIGSVGRMAAVKDFQSLVRAFLRMLEQEPESRRRMRLMIVGDGVCRQECLELLRAAGAESLAWLPGERSDIAELMRAMDVFALPSLGEGISNTILEAMASGLPVVATQVGGNAELVREGCTGKLVPPQNYQAMADSLLAYYRDPDLRRSHGEAARQSIEAGFSMDAMTRRYLDVYDEVLR